jgi:hypothetical protein
MRACGEVDVNIRVFLTSALVGDKWSAPHPGRFNLRERANVRNKSRSGLYIAKKM